MLSTLVLSSLVTALPPALLPASMVDDGDWPQWRGPHRDGISRESAWVPEGRNLWEVQVGQGYSTVSIADGRLYTVGFDEEGGVDVLWCLDAETGEELWAHASPADKMAKFHGGGTLCTPTVDGDDVYVLQRQGRYACLDAKTGAVRFEVDLMEKYGLELPTWGFSASPLVLEDQVVLNVGRVVAYAKGEAKELWATERNYGHAYSTPTPCTLRGKDCLAVFAGSGLTLLDLRGKELVETFPWRTQYDVNAASPVVIGDDRLFISAGYNHGGALVKLGEKGLEGLWETKEMRNQMATSVLIGEHLYGLDEAVLKCFDLNGKELWRERGLGKGALSAAGDRLLIVSSRGELVIGVASPEGFEEVAREEVLDGGTCWTMPVLSNGRIYLRNREGQLVCRDHRKPE